MFVLVLWNHVSYEWVLCDCQVNVLCTEPEVTKIKTLRDVLSKVKIALTSATSNERSMKAYFLSMKSGVCQSLCSFYCTSYQCFNAVCKSGVSMIALLCKGSDN